MGLNLSNQQIAKELELDKDVVQDMTTQLRKGIEQRKSTVKLSGIVEMEGFWSLLRSWLRPHRGISQEKLPLYLGFFEFVHNAKKRGKALLSTLLDSLISLLPRNTY